MNSQELVLKHSIMQRVRFIYGIKSIPRVFVPKIALLSSLVAIVGFFVSFPNVIKNMPSLFEVSKFFEFVSVAFVKTDFVVQVGSLIVFAVAFYIITDAVKTFRRLVKYSIVSA